MIEHDAHCGPFWLPRKVKVYLSSGYRNEACAMHDHDYGEQKMSRFQADCRMYGALLYNTKTAKQFFVNTLYFLAVRSPLGWLSWKNNQREISN